MARAGLLALLDYIHWSNEVVLSFLLVGFFFVCWLEMFVSYLLVSFASVPRIMALACFCLLVVLPGFWISLVVLSIVMVVFHPLELYLWKLLDNPSRRLLIFTFFPFSTKDMSYGLKLVCLTFLCVVSFC